MSAISDQSEGLLNAFNNCISKVRAGESLDELAKTCPAIAGLITKRFCSGHALVISAPGESSFQDKILLARVPKGKLSPAQPAPLPVPSSQSLPLK